MTEQQSIEQAAKARHRKEQGLDDDYSNEALLEEEMRFIREIGGRPFFGLL
jgi:hypothetical protein